MKYVDVGVLFCYHLDVSMLFNADVGILPRSHIVFLMVDCRLMTPSHTFQHQFTIVVSHLTPPSLHMHPPQIPTHLQYITLVPTNRDLTKLVNFKRPRGHFEGAGAGAVARGEIGHPVALVGGDVVVVDEEWGVGRVGGEVGIGACG